MEYRFTPIREVLPMEIVQREQEGYDVRAVRARYEALGPDAPAEALEELYQELLRLPPPSQVPFEEPCDFEAIVAALPPYREDREASALPGDFEDRVLGAWLGRAAGCLLGKPVEGWTREEIDAYLAVAGGQPLDDYVPYLDPSASRTGSPPRATQPVAGGVRVPHLREACRGHIRGMLRDDDMDYTILGLHVLATYGRDFTTADVAREWLQRLPYGMVYTAERVAYRNLVNDLEPPHTALHRNPYREWIGAQIRADAYGYVAAGHPQRAAEWAWRDARLSHVKNGIYGAMWVAAMVATAFTTRDVREVVRTGLQYVPPRSRLGQALRQVVAWSQQDGDWRQTWAKVHARFGHYHWVHVIPNAAVVCMALVHGRGEFGRTITIAVNAGYDTDCNGATAGSIVGAITGASGLPEKWVGPLGDTVESIVVGYHACRLSDLARRTAALARQIRG